MPLATVVRGSVAWVGASRDEGWGGVHDSVTEGKGGGSVNSFYLPFESVSREQQHDDMAGGGLSRSSGRGGVILGVGWGPGGSNIRDSVLGDSVNDISDSDGCMSHTSDSCVSQSGSLCSESDQGEALP